MAREPQRVQRGDLCLMVAPKACQRNRPPGEFGGSPCIRLHEPVREVREREWVLVGKAPGHRQHMYQDAHIVL